MIDMIFTYPDYEYTYTEGYEYPPDPISTMADGEEERLFSELCELFVMGAFDPERELLF